MSYCRAKSSREDPIPVHCGCTESRSLSLVVSLPPVDPMITRASFICAFAVSLFALNQGQTAQAQNRNITIILGQPAFPGGSRPVIVVGADRYVGATGFLPLNSTMIPLNSTRPPAYQGSIGLNSAFPISGINRSSTVGRSSRSYSRGSSSYRYRNRRR